MPPKRTRQSVKAQSINQSEEDEPLVEPTSPPVKRARRSINQSKPVIKHIPLSDPDAIKVNQSISQSLKIVGIEDNDSDNEITQQINQSLSSVAKTALSVNQSFFDLTKRNRTSNRTLAHLPTPSINQSIKYTPYTGGSDQSTYDRLIDRLTEQFKEWSLSLNFGMNVLLYGFGSKYKLINQFMNDWLIDGPVIVVAGFDQSFDLKSMLYLITRDVCMQSINFKDIQSHVDFIEQFFHEQSINQSTSQLIPHLTIVIHSFDGPSLRSSINQSTFAQLSRIQSIRIIASVDTGRAPLLWNQSINFASYEVSTFAPFLTEVKSHSRAKMEVKSSIIATRGVYAIMQSLTPMHRKVMTSLAKRFLEHLTDNEKARENRKKSLLESRKKKAKSGRKTRKGKRSVNPSLDDDDVIDDISEHESEAGSDEDQSINDNESINPGASVTRRVGVNCADFIASCQSELMASETSLQSSMRELITHDLVLEKRGIRNESIYVIPGTVDEITRHFIDEPKPEDSDTRQVDDSGLHTVDQQVEEEEEDEIVQFW